MNLNQKDIDKLIAQGATLGPAASIPSTEKPVMARGRARHEFGKMNKTEATYAHWLNDQLAAGLILGYWFEPLKLRLADKTYYNADFMVMCRDGAIEFHEVKGHWEDDARAKIKIAASQFWMFTFICVQKKGKEWKTEMISSN